MALLNGDSIQNLVSHINATIENEIKDSSNVATTSSAGLMSSSDKSKLNNIAENAEVNQNAFSTVKVGTTSLTADTKSDTLTVTAGSNITLTPDATNDSLTISATDTVYTHPTPMNNKTGTYRSVTVDANGHVTEGSNPTTLSGYGITDAATSTQGGKADTAVQSVKISGSNTELKSGTSVTLPAYPTTLPASDVSSWAKASSKPSYTASEVGADASGTASSLVKSNVTDKLGVNNGIATLDSTGKVPSTQLPSYVDDVLEYDNLASFPSTGESGKIYVAIDTNKTYRWSGTAYVVISDTLSLGETSSTAYRGDRGKTAYDHSQSAHAPSNAEKNTIVGIQKNGTDLTIDSSTRKVNVTVPTKVSDLTNDTGFTTNTGSVTSVKPGNGLINGTSGSSQTAITTSGTISLPAITRTNNTSTASPAHSGTFTAIDSVTTDTYGRVTAVNTKTVTLPSDNNTDTVTTVSQGTAITVSDSGTGGNHAYSISQTGENVSTALNLLGEGDSDAQRADYYIAQYAGGGSTKNTYYRRSVSKLFAAMNNSDVTTALGYTPAHSVTGANGTFGPTADVTGSNNTTIKVPKITIDSEGHVTSVTEYTYTSVNTDTDTHYESKNIIGTTNAKTENETTTNTTTYLNHIENGSVKSNHKITGTNDATVSYNSTNNTLTIDSKKYTGTGLISVNSSNVISTTAEANVITSVKKNGTALTVTNKAVDITVPTKVSDLTNDSGFTTNTGTVTKISTGVGLTGGDVTTTGTVKAKLRSETALTVDSAAATTTSGRVYPVAVDKTGYLSVNVPWTDNNTDTKITQNNVADNNAEYRPLLLAYSSIAANATTSSAETNSSYKHAYLSYKPSTKTLYIGPAGSSLFNTATTITPTSISTNDVSTRYLTVYPYDNDDPESGYFSEIWTANLTQQRQAILPDASGDIVLDSTFPEYIQVTTPISMSVSDNVVSLTHDNSGVTAGTYNSVTVNAKGHATAGSINYGSCSTPAATAAKTATCAGYVLQTGSVVRVKFTVTDTSTSAKTLNINSTGAKNIIYKGSNLTAANYLIADRVYEFVYNGSQYELVGDIGISNAVKTTTKGPTANVSGTNNTTIKVPKISIDAYGHVTELTEYTYTSVNTNTMNTAGATNSSSKLYLIGAPSQTANPQTYSNDCVYIDSGTNYISASGFMMDGTAESNCYFECTGPLSYGISVTGDTFEIMVHDANYDNTNSFVFDLDGCFTSFILRCTAPGLGDTSYYDYTTGTNSPTVRCYNGLTMFQDPVDGYAVYVAKSATNAGDGHWFYTIPYGSSTMSDPIVITGNEIITPFSELQISSGLDGINIGDSANTDNVVNHIWIESAPGQSGNNAIDMVTEFRTLLEQTTEPKDEFVIDYVGNQYKVVNRTGLSIANSSDFLTIISNILSAYNGTYLKLILPKNHTIRFSANFNFGNRRVYIEGRNTTINDTLGNGIIFAAQSKISGVKFIGNYTGASDNAITGSGSASDVILENCILDNVNLSTLTVKNSTICMTTGVDSDLIQCCWSLYKAYDVIFDGCKFNSPLDLPSNKPGGLIYIGTFIKIVNSILRSDRYLFNGPNSAHVLISNCEIFTGGILQESGSGRSIRISNSNMDINGVTTATPYTCDIDNCYISYYSTTAHYCSPRTKFNDNLVYNIRGSSSTYKFMTTPTNEKYCRGNVANVAVYDSWNTTYNYLDTSLVNYTGQRSSVL